MNVNDRIISKDECQDDYPVVPIGRSDSPEHNSADSKDRQKKMRQRDETNMDNAPIRGVFPEDYGRERQSKQTMNYS